MWPAAVAGVHGFSAVSGGDAGEALRCARRMSPCPTHRDVRPTPSRPAACARSRGRSCDILRASGGFVTQRWCSRPTRGAGTLSGFGRLRDRIASLGELAADVTPHVLRHSFASLAGDLGYSEPTIARLDRAPGTHGSAWHELRPLGQGSVAEPRTNAVAARDEARMGDVKFRCDGAAAASRRLISAPATP